MVGFAETSWMLLFLIPTHASAFRNYIPPSFRESYGYPQQFLPVFGFDDALGCQPQLCSGMCKNVVGFDGCPTCLCSPLCPMPTCAPNCRIDYSGTTSMCPGCICEASKNGCKPVNCGGHCKPVRGPDGCSVCMCHQACEMPTCKANCRISYYGCDTVCPCCVCGEVTKKCAKVDCGGLCSMMLGIDGCPVCICHPVCALPQCQVRCRVDFSGSTSLCPSCVCDDSTRKTTTIGSTKNPLLCEAVPCGGLCDLSMGDDGCPICVCQPPCTIPTCEPGCRVDYSGTLSICPTCICDGEGAKVVTLPSSFPKSKDQYFKISDANSPEKIDNVLDYATQPKPSTVFGNAASSMLPGDARLNLVIRNSKNSAYSSGRANDIGGIQSLEFQNDAPRLFEFSSISENVTTSTTPMAEDIFPFSRTSLPSTTSTEPTTSQSTTTTQTTATSSTIATSTTIATTTVNETVPTTLADCNFTDSTASIKIKLKPKVQLVPNRRSNVRECPSCDWRYFEHYKVKECRPIFGSYCSCPIRFECPLEFMKDNSLCYHDGKKVKPGTIIDTRNSCQLCRCAFYDFDNAEIECSTADCRLATLDEGCYFVYSQSFCCPVDKKCVSRINHIAENKESICVLEGKTYHYGQFMTPKSTPCITCYCSDQYDGIHGKTCYVQDCVMEKDRQLLRKGCIPIYREAYCCPIDFYCYNTTAVVISEPEKYTDEGDDRNRCKFGNRTYAVGISLQISGFDNCVVCSCTTPPEFTCVYRSCPKMHEYHSNCYEIREPGECCAKYSCANPTNNGRDNFIKRRRSIASVQSIDIQGSILDSQLAKKRRHELPPLTITGKKPMLKCRSSENCGGLCKETRTADECSSCVCSKACIPMSCAENCRMDYSGTSSLCPLCICEDKNIICDYVDCGQFCRKVIANNGCSTCVCNSSCPMPLCTSPCSVDFTSFPCPRCKCSPPITDKNTPAAEV